MLKYFLALLGIWAVHGDQFEVRMVYVPPTLTLLVPITDAEVTSVLFHFGLRDDIRIERGVRTAIGWQYIADITINNGDVIYAYADIHFSSGLRVTTPHASTGVHSLAEAKTPLGGRPIRAVLFRDDFDSCNFNNWRAEISIFGGMNWEFQVYTPELTNIFCRDSNIFLKPTLTVDDPRFDENFLHHGVMDVAKIWGYCTNNGNYGCSRDGQYGMLPPIMSGKVSSNPSIRFGTIEVRAKIPRGDWLWPAIWMMPKDDAYGGWPRSGEIDIMETRGNDGDLGVGTISSTLHWGVAWDQNKYILTHGEKHGSNFHDAYHTWRLDWSEEHLITYVDNEIVNEVQVGDGFWAKGGLTGDNIWAGGLKSAPFDQDFYIMFNVAVGGTNGYFPDDANWGTKKPWANNSPKAGEDFWNGRNDWLPSWQGDNVALQVDYVEFRN